MQKAIIPVAIKMKVGTLTARKTMRFVAHAEVYSLVGLLRVSVMHAQYVA